MRLNSKFARLFMAAFGLAIALPVAMTVASRVAKASGYIYAGGESCNPSPDNPDCVATDGQ